MPKFFETRHQVVDAKHWICQLNNIFKLLVSDEPTAILIDRLDLLPDIRYVVSQPCQFMQRDWL